ncbi:MAG: hypothetical protein ABI910_14775, partial [Gemmatimonadota bacterium]
FALDKAWSFLPGSVLTNITGHACRMPVGRSIRHVCAALAHLAAAAVCGILLVVSVDPLGDYGSRLAVARGLVLLIGWTSNFIVGISSRMLPV